MNKIPKFLKNKYSITFIVFLLYSLFLDDLDVFTLYHNLNKRFELQEQNIVMNQQLVETKKTLKSLHGMNYLEAYARSEKFFKKDNEDIFVIIYK
jgi:hypothetical protein